MKNFKKLTIALLIVLLLIGISNITLATEADEDYTFIPDDGAEPTNNNTVDDNNNTNTNTQNPYGNNSTNNSINNTVNNTNSSKYNNTNLPAAGSQDSTVVMIIVAVFGISALYAYKKIRDYNTK